MAIDPIARFRGFRLAPLQDVGAEVLELDIDDIEDAVAEDLRRAWAAYGLLLFRKTQADAEAHVRLASVFGPLAEHALKRVRGSGEARMVQLGGEAKGTVLLVNGERRAGFYYLHQDGAFTPTLARGGMLRMVKTPARGGDTIWVDTQKAYPALPPRLREVVDTHSAIYVLRHVPRRLYGWSGFHCTAEANAPPWRQAERAEFPPVIHPLAMSHPQTGRRVMILHPLGFVAIQGMEPLAGEALFDELVTFVSRPEFSYRHHWSQGDMVLYDNVRMLHGAYGYAYDDERIVQRTDIAASQPTGRALTAAELVDLAPELA